MSEEQKDFIQWLTTFIKWAGGIIGAVITAGTIFIVAFIYDSGKIHQKTELRLDAIEKYETKREVKIDKNIADINEDITDINNNISDIQADVSIIKSSIPKKQYNE